MKFCLSLVDVYKVVPSLNEHCVGKRVNTIYSLSNKTILIKLSDKTKILIDIGNKMYLTTYDVPTNAKTHQIQILLRQHLLNRIVLDIVQINFDRVVEIHFNLDYKLRIELYGTGNLAFYKSDELLYEYQKSPPPKEALKAPKSKLNLIEDPSILSDLFTDDTLPSKTAFNKFLSSFDYGKELNSLIVSQISSKSDFPIISQINHLIQEPATLGYVYYKRDTDQLLLDDIHTVSSVPLSNLSNLIEKQFPSFSLAMDTYFSQVEQAKVVQKQQSSKLALDKKFSDAKIDQQRRMTELQFDIDLCNLHATKIQEYTVPVTRILQLINSALETGMDWNKVEQVLELDKIRFKELEMVQQLLLKDNKVKIVLDEVPIVLELSKSDFQNVQSFYDKQKLLTDKLRRTELAYSHSIKNIQKSINSQQNKIEHFFKNKQILQKRVNFWFEKFHFFTTTDGYLVIAGRDAHQNELIVKRYMNKTDIYVHCDAASSPSCLIKSINNNDIPSRSVSEAGQFVVCLSKSWETKVVGSAYYVHPYQVSLTAPTGEYLKTGSFMIRGKKNYLPPVQLILGFGILFKISQESALKNHVKEPLEGQEYIKVNPEVDSVVVEAPVVNIFAQSTLNKIIEKPTSKIEKPIAAVEAPKPKKQRGKRSKKSDKYKDQDEDEKKIALQLVQGKKKENIVPVVKVKAVVEEKPFIPEKSQEEYDELKVKEAKEEMGEMTFLNMLVGDVKEEDEIEFGLTVCAPYEVLKNYKYKVKLTPGTERKGKSAKMGLAIFMANKQMTESEKQIIKVLNMDEMIRTIPNKCKVSAANLDAIKKKSKATKKKAKQKNKSEK